jgi:uncharacterized glyoxalase superfamily protein PhnB
MELAQARLVTDEVAALAGFYARLVGAQVTLNGYYVEVPAGAASLGFSRRRFTEFCPDRAARPACPHRREELILDFEARDVDAEQQRIAALGVDWVQLPTDQPWGNRSMTFRDPAGTLVSVFSRGQAPTG